MIPAIYTHLHVVSHHKSDDNKLTVVLEASGINDVTTSEARKLAIEHARSVGYKRTGVCSETGAYPVNDKGVSLYDHDNSKPFGDIVAYRNDITVMEGA